MTIKLIVAAAMMAGLAGAGPIPTIVWSGIVNVSGDISGSFSAPYAFTTADGLFAGSDESDNGCCGPFGSYMAETQFMVTIAGDFTLSSEVSYSVIGSNCSPVFCDPSSPQDPLTSSLTAATEITGPGGVVEAEQNLSASPNAASSVVYLAIGDYTLGLSESDMSGPDLDSSGGSSFSVALTPIATPEPGDLGLLLGAVIAIMYLRHVATSRPKQSGGP